MGWIEERVKEFLPLIISLGVEDEARIEQLCQVEIQAWRDRGLAQASLNSPMTAMRKAIKGIALTEHNTWVNPQKSVAEHIALRYMNFSKEEWSRIKGSTAKTVLSRMENQQFIDRPDEFVRIVSALLLEKSWPQLVVGLLGGSGRRLTEGVSTAQFREETDYTVYFTGQLKQPVADLCYEIPTLVPASLLIEALSRLREQKEIKDGIGVLTLNEVAHRYGPKVRGAAREALGHVLPAQVERQQIAAKDLRAAYARIAAHWYCPPHKSDRLYAATILGHIQGVASEEEALSRMDSEEHYANYLIGDGLGNQNGAKGIKLGEPGVVVLKAFQDPPKTEHPQTVESETPEKKRSSSKRSILQVMADTRARVLSRKKLGMKYEDDIVVALLDEVEQGEQSLEQLTPERLGFSAEEAQLIRQALALTSDQDFLAFIRKALPKEAKMRIGTTQRYKEVDLTQLATSALEKQHKSAALTQERIRRVVIALMLYNQQQSDPARRARITQTALHDMMGARLDHIREFFEKHREAIAEHHRTLEVPEKRSAKVDLEGIHIPEEPEVFGSLFLEMVQERNTTNGAVQ